VVHGFSPLMEVSLRNTVTRNSLSTKILEFYTINAFFYEGSGQEHASRSEPQIEGKDKNKKKVMKRE
jgi:hypothetical protein